jgi:hypothetical protein
LVSPISWTAPRTWVAGEVVTAAIGNTHWRDNLLDLADGSWGRDVQFAHTTADISTPLSAAWGNVTGFSFTAVSGGTYAIDCVMFLENPSSSSVDWRAGWTWTGAGAMTSGMSGLDTTVTAPAYNGTNTAHAVINDTASTLDETTGIGTPAAIPAVARVAATYVCTTGGTVQLRHRQDTSDASFATNVKHGSRMRAERVA